MKYDFDTAADRSGTYSFKWDVAEGELPMWVADMDFRTAPEVTEAVVKRAEHGIFGYTTVPDEWYGAYISWWKERHAVEYKKNELVFSTGVIPTLSACVRKFTSPAENVLVMTPVYNVFFNCIKNNGRNVSESPLIYKEGEYSADLDDLERKMSDPQTTLMFLCNPHNPVGKIWDRETLGFIGKTALKHGVVVVSDEIHCDLTDPGREYVPFASVSEECAKNSVICISPTKAFNLAGIQTSAAVSKNPRLRHRIWRELNTSECGEPNAFAIDAAAAAFTKGGEWLDELRGYIYQNKLTVKGFLEKNIPQVKLVPSEATYLLWLDCTDLGISSAELASHIRRKTGLFLTDGARFRGEGFLRMNIACPRVMLLDGLDRLKRAFEML